METWVPVFCTVVYVPVSPLLVPHLVKNVYMHQVHVFMSIQLPMLAKPPMDCYTETWKPLCGTACVCPSHPDDGPTP